jgi:hypothetical protein
MSVDCKYRQIIEEVAVASSNLLSTYLLHFSYHWIHRLPGLVPRTP